MWDDFARRFVFTRYRRMTSRGGIMSGYSVSLLAGKGKN